MPINLILCRAPFFKYKVNMFCIKQSLRVPVNKFKCCLDFIAIGTAMFFDTFLY